jgi:hypothetical protein
MSTFDSWRATAVCGSGSDYIIGNIGSPTAPTAAPITPCYRNARPGAAGCVSGPKTSALGPTLSASPSPSHPKEHFLESKLRAHLACWGLRFEHLTE